MSSKTIEVRGCDDCPCSVAVGQGFTVCQLFQLTTGASVPAPADNRTPEWCPLPLAPVTLRLRRTAETAGIRS